jgi:hypothetical protein
VKRLSREYSTHWENRPAVVLNWFTTVSAIADSAGYCPATGTFLRAEEVQGRSAQCFPKGFRRLPLDDATVGS